MPDTVDPALRSKIRTNNLTRDVIGQIDGKYQMVNEDIQPIFYVDPTTGKISTITATISSTDRYKGGSLAIGTVSATSTGAGTTEVKIQPSGTQRFEVSHISVYHTEGGNNRNAVWYTTDGINSVHFYNRTGNPALIIRQEYVPIYPFFFENALNRGFPIHHTPLVLDNNVYFELSMTALANLQSVTLYYQYREVIP